MNNNGKFEVYNQRMKISTYCKTSRVSNKCIDLKRILNNSLEKVPEDKFSTKHTICDMPDTLQQIKHLVKKVPKVPITI